jgi:hypothetical protein
MHSLSEMAGAVRTRFHSIGAHGDRAGLFDADDAAAARTTDAANTTTTTTAPQPQRRNRTQSDYTDTMMVKRMSLSGTAPAGAGEPNFGGRPRTESMPGRVGRSLSALVDTVRGRGRSGSSIHAVDLGVLESTRRVAVAESVGDESFQSCTSSPMDQEPVVEDDPDGCFICLQRFTAKRPALPIPCTKGCNLAPVHAKCIYEWKEQKQGSGTCPLCRSELGPVDYSPPDVLKLSLLDHSLEARKDFLTKPLVSEAGTVRFYVRVRNGLFGSPNTYEMYMQAPTTLRYPAGDLPESTPAPGDVLLMVGRKKYTRWGNTYVELQLRSIAQQRGKRTKNVELMGMVKSNMAGLEHVLVVPTQDNVHGSNATTNREIVAVQYTQNRVGSQSGPRQMSVVVPPLRPISASDGPTSPSAAAGTGVGGVLPAPPPLSNAGVSVAQVELCPSGSANPMYDSDDDDDDDDDDAEPQRYVTEAHRALSKDTSLSAVLKQQNKDTPSEKMSFVFGRNKEPYWLESIRAYSLDFQGRVTLPSNKNFQLEMDTNREAVAMQFGKVVSTDDGASSCAVYSMDVAWPLSPLQAFGIAVSSCDRKLACA